MSNGAKKVVYYEERTSPLKTDKLFSSRRMPNNEIDDDHHMNKEPSILQELSIDMIKCFPLDKMHLVDEVIVKKLLKLWTGNPAHFKLSASQMKFLSNNLEECSKFSPNDFQRKPRSLKYINIFKASECAVFLLYTGPLILQSIVSKKLYKNFISLSLAVRILTSPVYYKTHNNYTQKLMFMAFYI